MRCGRDDATFAGKTPAYRVRWAFTLVKVVMRYFRSLTTMVWIVSISSGYAAKANMGLDETRILQYQGVLRSGAVDASGLHDFRFGLFLSDSDPNAAGCLLNDPPNCALWSSERLGIQVSSGRFAVTLGETTPISDSILGQAALYLAIAVREDGDPAYALLQGLQRIVPAPLASRAAAANDFHVRGDLVVEGETFLGTTQTTNLTATGNIQYFGTLTGPTANVTTANVTTANVSTNAKIGNVNISGSTIFRGTAAPSTLDLGLYQTTPSWMRFVTNNSPIRFFTDGGSVAAGGTHRFSVESDGRLQWGFNEDGSSAQLLPDRFCVVVGLNDTCPAFWTQRIVKWDTEDDSNADSKDNVIAQDAGNSASVRMRFCCRGSGL